MEMSGTVDGDRVESFSFEEEGLTDIEKPLSSEGQVEALKCLERRSEGALEFKDQQRSVVPENGAAKEMDLKLPNRDLWNEERVFSDSIVSQEFGQPLSTIDKHEQIQQACSLSYKGLEQIVQPLLPCRGQLQEDYSSSPGVDPPSSPMQDSPNVDQPESCLRESVDRQSSEKFHPILQHTDQPLSPHSISEQADHSSYPQHYVAQNVDQNQLSSRQEDAQHLYHPSSTCLDHQNVDRPPLPLDQVSQNNQPSSGYRETQHVKRPSLKLQVSRHVNNPSAPLGIFQHIDQAPSPYQVLQQISGEAVKMAGEAFHSVYSSNSSPIGLGHRRIHGEVVNGFHRRSNSFHRLKGHMQKALRWGSNLREEGQSSSFNPEILANQKRQWYQLHSRALDYKKFQEPTSLFEHFIVTGVHPDANLEVVEQAFFKRKKWEAEMARAVVTDFKTLQKPGPSLPTLEPQILFKYPPGKKLDLRLKDLTVFCFPDGVKAHILERTPSLSHLNELVYGQEHLARDDLSFIFSLKAADNATLYGVCLHVSEIIQKRPGILGSAAASPMSRSSRRQSRYLMSAPRCYCLLTRVPFFELHFEMLNSIIAQERLNRITQFVTEMTLTDYSPTCSVSKSQNFPNSQFNSPDLRESSEWMASAISLDDAVALTAAAAGIIPDDEVPSTARTCEPESPLSGTREESDRNATGNRQSFDDSTSVFSEAHSEGLGQMYKSDENENGHLSPEIAISPCRMRTLDRISSSNSLFSPGINFGSEDHDDDDLSPINEKHNADEMVMEWAKENKNELLQIVCGYHALPVPARGSELTFLPLEHLQSIQYVRPHVTFLNLCENYLNLPKPLEAAELNVKFAAAEEAHALSVWTTATVCRTLSLDTILALLTGVLLEKQVVVVCQNLGVLSAIVLSLIPMIQPFEWQSLFLPVLPAKMLDFLDAPVPFIAGIQQKPEDLKLKASSLVHVNVLKDQVKFCNLPSLPRRKELYRKLEPFHYKLACEKVVAKRHPVHKCNEVQTEAASQFLAVMRWYLESLCSEMRSYTITNVQANNDRVSVLLKDSFIYSFPSRDRPFVKVFVDTQLFSVLSDFRLSTFEHG